VFTYATLVPVKFFNYAKGPSRHKTRNDQEVFKHIRKTVKLIFVGLALFLFVVGTYVGYAYLIAQPSALDKEFAEQFGVVNSPVFALVLFSFCESVDSVVQVKFKKFNTSRINVKKKKDVEVVHANLQKADLDATKNTAYSPTVRIAQE
jgi:hypothetical protein